MTNNLFLFPIIVCFSKKKYYYPSTSQTISGHWKNLEVLHSDCLVTLLVTTSPQNINRILSVKSTTFSESAKKQVKIQFFFGKYNGFISYLIKHRWAERSRRCRCRLETPFWREKISLPENWKKRILVFFLVPPTRWDKNKFSLLVCRCSRLRQNFRTQRLFGPWKRGWRRRVPGNDVRSEMDPEIRVFFFSVFSWKKLNLEQSSVLPVERRRVKRSHP